MGYILAAASYALVALVVWNTSRTQLLTLPADYRPSPVICGLFWGPALLGALAMLGAELFRASGEALKRRG